MVGALRPYLDISQAVRIGDLEAFHKAMQVRLRSPPAPALLLSLPRGLVAGRERELDRG